MREEAWTESVGLRIREAFLEEKEAVDWALKYEEEFARWERSKGGIKGRGRGFQQREQSAEGSGLR